MSSHLLIKTKLFKKETWGKGLAQEFVRGFLELYSSLPRQEVEIEVKKVSVSEKDGKAEEILTSFTTVDNVRSCNVHLKVGFENFTTEQEVDLRDSSKMVDLPAFRYFVNRK